jgi:hypothetical protein
MGWVETSNSPTSAATGQNTNLPLPIVLRIPRFAAVTKSTTQQVLDSQPTARQPQAVEPAALAVPLARKRPRRWPARVAAGVFVVALALAPTAVIRWPAWSPYYFELVKWVWASHQPVDQELRNQPVMAKDIKVPQDPKPAAPTRSVLLVPEIVPLEKGGAS